MTRTVTQSTEALAASLPLRPAVLIVDPDAAVRRVLRLVLEGAGHPCMTCSNVEDAVELAADHQPVLVLLDVALRDTESDVPHRIAEAAERRPRVALMGSYPRPRTSGEDFFVPKPIAFDHLLQLLESVEREYGE